MFTRPNLVQVMILIMLLWLSASGIVHADSPNTTSSTQDIGLESAPNIGNVITVIVVLILIIGLIIILIRFLAQKNNSWFATRSIRHLGGVGIGQNKSVQMVKVGSSLYVVGVGDNITLLDKIDEQEEIDAILQSMNSTSTMSGKGIVSFITKSFNFRRARIEPLDDTSSSEASSFQEIFHNKMQQVSTRRKQLKNMLEDDNKIDGDKS